MARCPGSILASPCLYILGLPNPRRRLRPQRHDADARHPRHAPAHLLRTRVASVPAAGALAAEARASLRPAGSRGRRAVREVRVAGGAHRPLLRALLREPPQTAVGREAAEKRALSRLHL